MVWSRTIDLIWDPELIIPHRMGYLSIETITASIRRGSFKGSISGSWLDTGRALIQKLASAALTIQVRDLLYYSR